MVRQEHPDAWKREALETSEQEHAHMNDDDEKTKAAAELLTQTKENVADALNEVWDEIRPGKVGQTEVRILSIDAYEQLKEAMDAWKAAGQAFANSLIKK